MRYHVLACDYDGTIAHHGEVDPIMLAALERLAASGRKLVLVSGRELDDLIRAFPGVVVFDRVVAENGALVYRPDTREVKTLGPPPSEQFVQTLRDRGVKPLSVGRVIVATWEPHQNIVLSVIRELGLELQVIFNKGAVMVLPSGTNKRTGLLAALSDLGMSIHNVVGVGDAENDHAFLQCCECAVAVQNALPALKQQADFVTPGDHGVGVCELAEMLLEDDLASIEPKLVRHNILVGASETGEPITFSPHGSVVLVAGSSGGGKSNAATALLERVTEQSYQTCVIDPEGDYDSIEWLLNAGTAEHPPDVEQVMQILKNPNEHVAVNLLGVPLADRPQLFLKLLARLHEFRGATGRPHWLFIDEAHHVVHSLFEPAPLVIPQNLASMLLITVHPERIHSAMLERVNVLIAVGADAASAVRAFANATGRTPPEISETPERPDHLLVWRLGKASADANNDASRADDRARRVVLDGGRTPRRRHRRKYAAGELGPDKSFYFRGPEQKLNLRAQNLNLFNQLAEGVDDDTWRFHLENGDYTTWFRDAIKDEDLARTAEQIAERHLSASESRDAIRRAIDARYTSAA